MSRMKKSEMIEIAESKHETVTDAKIYAANTLQYKSRDTTYYQYHETDVVKQRMGIYILNTGRWRTKTTKDRINQILEEAQIPLQISQKDNVWYVVNKHHSNTYMEFYEGIQLIGPHKPKNLN